MPPLSLTRRIAAICRVAACRWAGFNSKLNPHGRQHRGREPGGVREGLVRGGTGEEREGRGERERRRARERGEERERRGDRETRTTPLPCLESIPSMQARSWLSVCSPSSCDAYPLPHTPRTDSHALIWPRCCAAYPLPPLCHTHPCAPCAHTHSYAHTSIRT